MMPLLPIQELTLTAGASTLLCEEFAAHVAAGRREELGWLLLGLRGEEDAVILATVPAGVDANAGEHHVRFDAEDQLRSCQRLREVDPRLAVLGVAHTHPGSLRQPSSHDYLVDALWVLGLPGHDGIFGIGTADARTDAFGEATAANARAYAGVRFSWYGLAVGGTYRRLPVVLAEGPDLGAILRTKKGA